RVDAAEMSASGIPGEAVRGNGHHQIQVPDDEDVLSAIAPGEPDVMTRHLAIPPAIAIVASLPAWGLRADLQRLIHPLPRYDLIARGSVTDAIRRHAAVGIHLAEGEHLPGRHLHVVAAEVNALGIGGPVGHAETHRSGQ